MKTLIATLRRAVTRARGPFALRQQRAHVRALAEQLDSLEAGLCDPCPADPAPFLRRTPSAEDIRARTERKLKEALL